MIFNNFLVIFLFFPLSHKIIHNQEKCKDIYNGKYAAVNSLNNNIYFYNVTKSINMFT